ncbi:MAG: LppX_LprAFG lipoprotein [Aeromicrobium sp.]
MRTRSLTLVLVAAVIALSGCSGSDKKDSPADTSKLQARLATAKATIDDAETVKISLSTEKIPSGVSGLLSAKGNGNHTPAFKGKVTVVTGGTSLGADVIAVDGMVLAKTSFSPDYLSIDPESLKAPDPAALFDNATGITQILVKTAKLSDGGKSRDGSDVLTTIKGTLPGDVVKTIIPSAATDATFKVTYRLDDDDVLRDAMLSGPFYGKGHNVTYTVKLTTSDKPVKIEAPTRPGA